MEFLEVMRQLDKLCCQNNCGPECPMDENDCCKKIGYCSDPRLAERIERVVMQWAADHPDPIYPTWQEWFDTFESGIDVDEPIPADIAQKLEIEPKEG